MMKDIALLARKDLRLEFRKKETLFSMALFSFSAVLIFSAFFNFIDIPLDARYSISIASVLFIITFTVMLGITSIFSRELKKNSIYPILSLAIKPQVIFLAKLVYLIVLLLIIEILTLLLSIVFLRIDFQGNFVLLIIIITIGTLDLAIAGCIVAFLTMYSKSKTLAIPVLYFPLILPSLLIATQVSMSLVLYNDFEFFITNSLVLFLHAVIILILALVVTEE
ncbi:MAG: heme exporter protein CcmB, partial [Promethearchaeota archaeon]